MCEVTGSRSQLHMVLLFLILLLGLHLRIGAVLNTVVDTPVRADAQQYYLYGLNILHNGTFSRTPPGVAPVPDTFRPPLYPLAISPFLEFPPSDRMLVHIGLTQALLSTLTILLTFLLFRRLGGNAAALLAAALAAISPHLISLNVYMLTETLFTFLMMGGLLLMAWAVSGKGKHYAVSAGVLLGLAGLTRSTLEHFPVFLLLIWVLLWRFAPSQRVSIRNLLYGAGSALAVIAIWKIRNLVELGVLSDPTLMINLLHQGTYPDFMFEGDPRSLGIPYRFDPRSGEIAKSVSSVLHELVARVRSDPWPYVKWYAVGKPVALLSWSMVDGWGDVFVYPVLSSPYFGAPLYTLTHAAMLGLHGPLMVLAMIAAMLMLIRPKSLGCDGVRLTMGVVISGLVIYFLLLHAIGAPFPRYGVPLRPVMYGLASVFLSAVGFRVVSYLRTSMARRSIVEKDS